MDMSDSLKRETYDANIYNEAKHMHRGGNGSAHHPWLNFGPFYTQFSLKTKFSLKTVKHNKMDQFGSWDNPFATPTYAVKQKRGVCYLSRVPPRMEPSNLRRILSSFGDIQRIYLTPEDPTVQVRRKKAGGFRGKEFSEGWVEFTKKSVAKNVANMLNGEQMGGKRRSSFFYDTWNIKYLSNFKWDDLTSDLANKNRTREQKLALELSAAKRERDFYLSKVDQSRALNAMRKKKTQKAHGPPPVGTDVEEPKVIRKFPQNRPVERITVESKSRLSKDFLSEVFGGS